jgi:hypothetical protein
VNDDPKPPLTPKEAAELKLRLALAREAELNYRSALKLQDEFALRALANRKHPKRPGSAGMQRVATHSEMPLAEQWQAREERQALLLYPQEVHEGMALVAFLKRHGDDLHQRKLALRKRRFGRPGGQHRKRTDFSAPMQAFWQRDPFLSQLRSVRVPRRQCDRL